MARRRGPYPDHDSSVIHEPSWREREREGRRRARPPRNPRRLIVPVLVVVLVGAIAVVAAGATGRGPYAQLAERFTTTTAPSTLPAGTTTTTLEFGLDGRTYRVGDCVLWDQEAPPGRYHATDVVPCDRDHLLEIAGHTQVPAAHGAPVPTDEQWNEIITRHCRALAEGHLGAPIDPNGRYDISAIHPSDEGWRAGDRDMACGLQANWRTPGAPTESRFGIPLTTPFTGAVRDRSQFWDYRPGDCLTDESPLPVPCTAPHQEEVTGSITLDDSTVIPAPDDTDAWSGLIGDRCYTSAQRHLGGGVSDPWSAGWIPIRAESWAAGARAITCFVGQWNGTGWMTLTMPARSRPA